MVWSLLVLKEPNVPIKKALLPALAPLEPLATLIMDFAKL